MIDLKNVAVYSGDIDEIEDFLGYVGCKELLEKAEAVIEDEVLVAIGIDDGECRADTITYFAYTDRPIIPLKVFIKLKQNHSPSKLVQDHWNYINELLNTHNAHSIDIAEFHYKTAFHHGYKHCLEDISEELGLEIYAR